MKKMASLVVSSGAPVAVYLGRTRGCSPSMRPARELGAGLVGGREGAAAAGHRYRIGGASGARAGRGPRHDSVAAQGIHDGGLAHSCIVAWALGRAAAPLLVKGNV